MRQDPVNVDHAFNFFTTAEHMLDWLYPGFRPFVYGLLPHVGDVIGLDGCPVRRCIGRAVALNELAYGTK